MVCGGGRIPGVAVLVSGFLRNRGFEKLFTKPHRLNLVCQGACGLGGQDWDGPHLLVGRLVLGHTVRGEGSGGVDRSL